MLNRIGKIAGMVGRGAAAGIVATAVMTVSSTLEMKLRERSGSTVPAKTAGKVLGVQPRDPEGGKRFGTIVHWGYGTAWGGIGGLIRALGVPEPAATATHFASIWGTELVMLPAMGTAPPPTEWGIEEVAMDAWHHLVYVGTMALAWIVLRPEKRTRWDQLLRTSA